jgi:DNA-directed RNA polymerase III subunit RPC11
MCTYPIQHDQNFSDGGQGNGYSFVLFRIFSGIKINNVGISSNQESLQLCDNMHFCPRCGNLLLVEEGNGMRFFCPTCPYVHRIESRHVSHVALKPKEVDDILGGASAWENVDRTEARCPYCAFGEAFFMQIQIRSADEPMTTFYRCVQCAKQWHD